MLAYLKLANIYNLNIYHILFKRWILGIGMMFQINSEIWTEGESELREYFKCLWLTVEEAAAANRPYVFCWFSVPLLLFSSYIWTWLISSCNSSSSSYDYSLWFSSSSFYAVVHVWENILALMHTYPCYVAESTFKYT